MSKPPFFIPKHHALHAPRGRYGVYEECPERVQAILTGLSDSDYFSARPVEELVAETTLYSIHSRDYVTFLKELSLEQEDDSEYELTEVFGIRPPVSTTQSSKALQLARFTLDTNAPVGSHTWEASANSAFAAESAARIILSREHRLAYACCRPPGHHAGRDYMGGFCYLNNGALAAELLKPIGRVAFIDIDYHHGNGTQDIFYEDPEVFFLSLHGDPATEYPFLTGFSDELGRGHGLGTNLNIPLPPGTGGDTYLEALQSGLKALQDFSPVSLVVSLGFDTYKDDPLTEWKLTEQDFQSIGAALSSLNLPTVVIQEGGYLIGSLGVLAQAFFDGFCGMR